MTAAIACHHDVGTSAESQRFDRGCYLIQQEAAVPALGSLARLWGSRLRSRSNTAKVMAFQPPLMTNEDLERLLEVCRPYRSYAAWALWGVTDECAFLPVGGVLQRLAY